MTRKARALLLLLLRLFLPAVSDYIFLLLKRPPLIEHTLTCRVRLCFTASGSPDASLPQSRPAFPTTSFTPRVSDSAEWARPATSSCVDTGRLDEQDTGMLSAVVFKEVACDYDGSNLRVQYNVKKETLPRASATVADW